MKINIRWLLKRDIESLVNMEAETFEYPWTYEEYVFKLRSRNTIGMVAEFKEKIVGTIIYQIHKRRIIIDNIFVDKWCVRNGIGTKLINYLKNKLSDDRRNAISITVREKNLDTQLFLKSCGFVCAAILYDSYDNTDEDAYLFEYHKPKSTEKTNHIISSKQSQK